MLNGLKNFLRGGQLIVLDYPVRSVPRYGFGKPRHAALHQLLDRNRAAYKSLLEQFLVFESPLSKIPIQPSGKLPGWRNGFFPGLDSVSLYGLLALKRPKRLVEVGSGNSTRFARLAIDTHSLPTRITSIDPHPRADIESISHEILRQPLEDADLGVFERLEPGDMVFIDGSHRCFMNSDVTVFFLDILPNLKPGVLVEIHDILLPEDYPPDWIGRYYSEQYLLATYLLAKGSSARVVLPNYFITTDPELSRILDPLWSKLGDVERNGGSFWFET